MVISIEKLLKDLGIASKGIERGGLSIKYNGAPGALIAHGVIQNKEQGFSSNLNFLDPAGVPTSTLNGAGLFLARPASKTGFPETSFFTPQLALKNAWKSSQTAKVTVWYKAGSRTESKVLPAISLTPHQVQMVDFTRVIAGLRNALVESAGLKIEHTGEPGSLVATLSSIDQSKSLVVGVPLVSRVPNSAKGGTHPFLIDENTQSIAYITNTVQKPTKALLVIFHEGGLYTPELIGIGPGATVAIDIGQLRDSQTKDVLDRTLPEDLSEGQLLWRPHGGEALIGRIVVFDKRSGTASNFSCPNCCAQEPIRLAMLPDPLSGTVGGFQQVTVHEYDTVCGSGEIGPYDVTDTVTYSCDNPSVLTVNSTGGVDYLAVGSTMVTMSLFYYHSDYISAEDCGLFGQTWEEECPGAVRPTISSLDMTHGTVGLAYSITITGTGFAAGASVSAGSGITVSGVQVVNTTTISALFDVATNAQGGNHQVVVTVAGQSSTDNVNFFVQIPTRLRRDSYSNLIDEQGGCGAHRDITYTLLDQQGQPIDTDQQIMEILSNYSGPAGLKPNEKTIDMLGGQANDSIGYSASPCPQPFTATMTQTFKVLVGSGYTLTTTNSISMGRNANGTKFVDVQITTQ